MVDDDSTSSASEASAGSLLRQVADDLRVLHALLHSQRTELAAHGAILGDLDGRVASVLDQQHALSTLVAAHGLAAESRSLPTPTLETRFAEISNQVLGLQNIVMGFREAMDFRSLPTATLETRFFELANQVAEVRNIALSCDEATRSRSLPAPHLETLFANLAHQVAEVRNLSVDVQSRIASSSLALDTRFAEISNQLLELRNIVMGFQEAMGHRSLPRVTLETRFVELATRITDVSQICGHLLNRVENVILEVQSLRPKPRDPGALLDAVEALGEAIRCWPPYAADIHLAGSSDLIRQGFKEALARAAEHVCGTPQGVACTTQAVAGAAPNELGPIVIACASLDSGGAERQAALTVTHLSQRKLSSVFVGYSPDGSLGDGFYAPLLETAGVPIVDAAHDSPRDAAGLLNHDVATRLESLHCGAEAASFLWGYFGVFASLLPRVVHTWLDYTNTIAGLAALWAGVPRVILGLRNVNPSHLPFYQPFFRPLYHLLLTDPRVALVANSRAGAVDYAQWLGIDPDVITVVYNGFTPAAYGDSTPGVCEAHDICTAPLILGVAQLRPEKDPLLFVATCANIVRLCPDARFMLVGSGPLEDEAIRMAHDLHIGDRLEFTGRRTDVLACMRHADIFLHTAHVEGLPNVLLEAQSAGLPIVAAAAGGVAEAIDPGVTGVVVHSREPRVLAEEVARRLSNREWYDRARRAGPLYVEQRFSVDRMIDATLAVYDGKTRQAMNG